MGTCDFMKKDFKDLTLEDILGTSKKEVKTADDFIEKTKPPKIKTKSSVKLDVKSSEFLPKTESQINKAFTNDIIGSINKSGHNIQEVKNAFADYTRGRIKFSNLSVRDGDLLNNVMKSRNSSFLEFENFSTKFYNKNLSGLSDIDDVMKILNKESWFNKLTFDEKEITANFFNKGAKKFNPQIFKKVVKESSLMQDTLENSLLKQDVKLFRMNINTGSQLKKLNVGDEFLMNQHVSTSWDKTWFDTASLRSFSSGGAEQDIVLWEIEAPLGTKGAVIKDVAIDRMKDQAEVLLSSGQKFKVIGTKTRTLKLYDDDLGRNINKKVLVQIIRVVG